MENCLQYVEKWYRICLALIFVILAGLVMIFRYFLQIKANSITLKKNDEQQQEKITKLEQKNGNEQYQIDSLKERFTKLEDLIISKRKKAKPLKA
ncbi:MAG: hypothetical protein LBR43_03430 [Spiroplasmataceae bacterium]|nr:hypothetical protein [Spiroplasmataceae bacterium]